LQFLEQEKNQLAEELLVRTGEINIVRSKQERQAKEHERELMALRKLNAEQQEKIQREAEMAKKAAQVKATELQFAQAELREEAHRNKTLQKQRERAPLQEQTTPKKNATSFRDGFEDVDMLTVSPSKHAGRRSAQSSPRKQAPKRKRSGVRSSANALEVAQEDAPATNGFDETTLKALQIQDDRLDLLEGIMRHRLNDDKRPTLEEFTVFFFPSQPKLSFTSTIMEKLPSITSKQPITDFPIELSELFISIWSQCLAERFYGPIYLLLDLVRHMVDLQGESLATQIVGTLLPVLQSTVELVALPRFDSRYPKFEHGYCIDVTACLKFIQLLCDLCALNEDSLVRFWQYMRADFVMIILSVNQPLEHSDIMLQLLPKMVMTSSESIAPVVGTGEQSDHLRGIFSRLAILLINTPKSADGTKAHTPTRTAQLHVQVLTTLSAFVEVEIGKRDLGLHQNVFARIVKVLYDAIDVLYKCPPYYRVLTKVVILSVKLLWQLVDTHKDTVETQAKLNAIHGGSQKYLLALSRLHYADTNLPWDVEIGEAVENQVGDLLTSFLSPDEGDAMHEAFVGPEELEEEGSPEEGN
jgi:hypothetical protein